MANGAVTFGGSDGLSFAHIVALDGATKASGGFWVKPISAVFFGYFMAQIGATGTGTGNTDGFGFLQSSTDATSLFGLVRNADNTPEKSSTGLLSASIFQPIWWAFDGTQGTVTNRFRIWISGSEITSWGTDSNNFPASLGTSDQPFTIGFGEGSLFNNCIIADPGILFGRAITDSTIASHAAGMSILNYAQAGDFVATFRTDFNDENGSRTASTTGSPTLTTGPSLTYPGGGPAPTHLFAMMGIGA